MKYRPKHIAEYILLKGVAGVVCVLPHRAALCVGWVLAFLAFHVVRFRRTAAERRIRLVVGDAPSRREVRRIAWVSLRNTFFNAMELARTPRMTRGWLERAVDIRGGEVLRARAKEGGGLVLAVPHTGNWDQAGSGMGLLGFPIFMITGVQKNPLADAFMNRMRFATGVEGVPRGSHALRRALHRLKKGMFLAIMPDLRSRTKALDIAFLGGRANLPEGMALFARMGNVPIYPAIVTREGWARHRWVLCDPVRPDPGVERGQDLQRMTQQVMDVFDRAIRERPDQYFWYNKRWVLDPLPPETRA
jgi:lauroyl/myristoyl acyltransferase